LGHNHKVYLIHPFHQIVFIHFRQRGTHLVGYMIQHALEDLFLVHELLLEHLLASMER